MKENRSIKIIYISVVISFLFTTLIFPQQNKNAIYDDLNNKFLLSDVPQKVISLAPNLTEIIFKLGQGNKIIGDTKYCNYPEEAKKVDKVGDMLSVNYEKIVQLDPDIIFLTVEGNNKQQYKKLQQLGYKIFVSNPRDYLGIKKTFLDIAKIFNVENTALKQIGGWDKKINSVQTAIGKSPRKTAMFLISVNPLMAAGPNTFVNQFLVICGLKNILSNTISNYPIINREEVLKKNPDYIIVSNQNTNFISNALSIFPEWKDINAIRENNVISVNPDLFFRPGPRFAEAVQKLYSKIYRKLKTE